MEKSEPEPGNWWQEYPSFVANYAPTEKNTIADTRRVMGEPLVWFAGVSSWLPQPGHCKIQVATYNFDSTCQQIACKVLKDRLEEATILYVKHRAAHFHYVVETPLMQTSKDMRAYLESRKFVETAPTTVDDLASLVTVAMQLEREYGNLLDNSYPDKNELVLDVHAIACTCPDAHLKEHAWEKVESVQVTLCSVRVSN